MQSACLVFTNRGLVGQPTKCWQKRGVDKTWLLTYSGGDETQLIWEVDMKERQTGPNTMQKNCKVSKVVEGVEG